MKKILFILTGVALLLLTVSCKKDHKINKGNYGGDGVTPKPEAVDLGLSVKWASFNLGASKPEEYGDHYAWGEITSKDNYSWTTYKWCTGAEDKLTKYCPKDKAGDWDATAKPDGPDGEVKLLPSDDVAHVKLGGKWRMPTDAEWKELLENCTWTHSSLNDVHVR